jgi:plasmid stabilization system protein ParE
MRLRYSPRAAGDLAAIGDYLRERSPSGARAVEAKIKSTLNLLAACPQSGRTLEQRRDVRVMPLVRYPFLVFYTVMKDEIVILHIRHAARAPIVPDDL